MLRPAPSAMLPGSWVAGGPTRVTTPCSWSVLISSGMSAPLRGRDPLQPVGQAGDLLRVGHVVGPGEVDDAAEVVLLDQLLAVGDPELALVVRDVGGVGRVRGLPVGVGDEELADLLLQRHPLDDLVDPVAAAGRRRPGHRGQSDRTGQEQRAEVGVGRGSRARCLQRRGARRAARVSSADDSRAGSGETQQQELGAVRNLATSDARGQRSYHQETDKSGLARAPARIVCVSYEPRTPYRVAPWPRQKAVLVASEGQRG